MLTNELETLCKKKKLTYQKDNNSYKFEHFTLELCEDGVYYISSDVKSKVFLSDDKVSGVLNMTWNECQYAKSFAVTGFIHPGRHQDAREYLFEDNMTQYFRRDEDPLNIITDMRWDLQKDQSGFIICTSKASFPRWYFAPLDSFCNGQNSDGLGEEFEQQDFITMAKGMAGKTILSDESYWFKY